MTQPIPGIPEVWQGILRRDNCIPAFTPTVESILAATLISNGIHRWPTKGGTIQVATADLRQALEDAYNSLMPNWPAMVEIDDA
jgi:hypothetical protein